MTPTAASPPKRPRGRPRGSGTTVDGGTGTVQALDRGLHILSTLADGGASTLTDLALRAGMPASSAHRLLSTLQKHGIVGFDDGTQEWTVGLEAFRIGNAFLRRTNLMESGRDIMRRLMEQTGETANLAVGDDGDVVFVSQVETHQPIRAFFTPGTRSPMHVSGIGKALMAEMPEDDVARILERRGLAAQTPKTLRSPDALFEDLRQTRSRGWSLDDEEGTVGMRCVAAAVFNVYGEAIAGISVSGPTVRLTDAAVADVASAVRAAAKDVTLSIGGVVPDR